jgi:hypothetical protein
MRTIARFGRTRTRVWMAHSRRAFAIRAVWLRRRLRGTKSTQSERSATGSTVRLAAGPRSIVRQACRYRCPLWLSPKRGFPPGRRSENRRPERCSTVPAAPTFPYRPLDRGPCPSARLPRRTPSAVERPPRAISPSATNWQAADSGAHGYGPTILPALAQGRAGAPTPSPARAIVQTRFPPFAPAKRDKRRSSTLCTRFKRDAIVPAEHPRMPAIAS